MLWGDFNERWYFSKKILVLFQQVLFFTKKYFNLYPFCWLMQNLFLKYVGFILEERTFFINIQKCLLQKKKIYLAQRFQGFIQLYFIWSLLIPFLHQANWTSVKCFHRSTCMYNTSQCYTKPLLPFPGFYVVCGLPALNLYLFHPIKTMGCLMKFVFIISCPCCCFSFTAPLSSYKQCNKCLKALPSTFQFKSLINEMEEVHTVDDFILSGNKW